MTDEEKKDSNVGSLAFPIFILNVVVLANTTREGFIQVFHSNGETFYLYNQISTWCTLGLFVLSILTACGVVGSSAANDGEVGWFGMICGSVALLALVAYLVTCIVFVGIMWYNDPEHTFLGYKKYWSEGATDFTSKVSLVDSNAANRTLTSLRGGNNEIALGRRLAETGGLVEWPYVMYDVLARISGFGMFFIDTAVGVMLVGGLFSLICCREQKQTSHTFTTGTGRDTFTTGTGRDTFTTGTGRATFSTHSGSRPVVVSAGGRTPVVANGQLGLVAGSGNV